MYGLLLKGQAEALYTRLTASTTPVTVRVITDAITEMTREYLPIDCAKNTSRYLQALKKPFDMSIENFYTRVKTIDSFLPLMLPPLNVSLSTEQLTALIEHAVPSEWLHHLNLQQTLGQNLNVSTMIQYFKILEVNERNDSRSPHAHPKPNKSHSKSSKNRQHSSDEETSTKGKTNNTARSVTVPVRTSPRTNPTGKWCTIHKSTSHNTSECRSATKETGQQEAHNIEPKVKTVLKKKAPREEVHKIEQKELSSDSESSDEEELYVMNDIPRCDIRLIIRGPNKNVLCKALLDTGSSKTIIDGSSLLEAAGISMEKAEPIVYHTKEGTFTTNKQAQVTAVMPQFSKHRTLQFTAQVDDRRLIAATYDIIIGRDFLSKYKIKLDFSSNPPSIHWDELQLEMVYKIETQADQVRAKLRTTVNGCTHLSNRNKEQLFTLLQRYQSVFNGTLGIAKGVAPIELDLKDGAKSIQSRPIPIPEAKLHTVKQDIQELEDLGVIERCPPSEWSFPSFVVPKKDGTDRLVTDFRKLNEVLKRKPFPIPTLSELIHSLHGFTYVTLMDLRKGYYHFPLSKQASQICTTILPWGYYRYKRLPMGISPAADIFQFQISNLLMDLTNVKVYFDDLLVYSKGT